MILELEVAGVVVEGTARYLYPALPHPGYILLERVLLAALHRPYQNCNQLRV